MAVWEVHGDTSKKRTPAAVRLYSSSMVRTVHPICRPIDSLLSLGTVGVDNTFKYPIPCFAAPPMERSVDAFASASSLDLFQSRERFFDTLTWSATDELSRRPSLSGYANRYERHAKDGFVYWPKDLIKAKPRGNRRDMVEYVVSSNRQFSVVGKTAGMGNF